MNTTFRKLMILFLCISASAAAVTCSRNSSYSTNIAVDLEGKVEEKEYRDADNRPEKALVLLLEKPIDVSKDDFGGPVQGVKEIQLVVYNRTDVSGLIQNRVRAKGELFYPTTAHHHTDVLMSVKVIHSE